MAKSRKPPVGRRGFLKSAAAGAAALVAGPQVGMSFAKERTLLYDASSGKLLPGAARQMAVNGSGNGGAYV